jgi:DMSO/TMAO reductase YedYZ molybdopterin-dependent catalytic subunit
MTDPHEARRHVGTSANHATRRHVGTSARIDRRGFLSLGLAGGLSSVVAACGWDGGNAVRPLLLDVSRLNDWVGEKILFSQQRLAPQYRAAERTVLAQFPSYFISSTLPMLADPKAWRLRVSGLVREPLTLSLDELRAMPRTTYTVKHHCVEGWSAIATWHGVPVSAIAERSGMLPQARYVRFDSFDSEYFNGWDLASAMHPQTILAYGMNDNPLPPSHGAPLRLYAPTKLGYKMTKYLVSVTFTAERPGGYWEDQGYPWFAGV